MPTGPRAMVWTHPKCPWADKFNRPTVDELRTPLPKPMHRVLDHARDTLTAAGTEEALTWQGIPWRWTLVYTIPGRPEGMRPFAYLIPDPQRLQLCVPLTQDQIESLPMKRLRKSIRDGVTFARTVAGVWWPTWDIPGRAALDEVLDLIERKHRLVAGEAILAGRA